MNQPSGSFFSEAQTILEAVRKLEATLEDLRARDDRIHSCPYLEFPKLLLVHDHKGNGPLSLSYLPQHCSRS